MPSGGRAGGPCSAVLLLYFFVSYVRVLLQVGEMIKDREAVVYGGMTGKGLKVSECACARVAL